MKTKTKIWLNVLLDESSSMCSTADATIEQFNSFIGEQKTVKNAQILATLTTFSDSPRHLYIARPVDQVPDLTAQTYHPEGCTALYDAIHASMQTVEDSMRREDEKTGVLFVIITDGGENASRQFSVYEGGLGKIRTMIAKRKKEGWNFVFLGEDIDAGHGEELGIASSKRVSKSNSKKMFSALSRSTSLYAGAIDRGEDVDCVFSLNAADYEDLDDEGGNE